MANYASGFNLSIETLQKLSNVYEGYANSLSKSKIDDLAVIHRSNREEKIRSCLVIAAIYRSLYDQRSSIELFATAAERYRIANLPYWKVLAICALDLRMLIDHKPVNEGNDVHKLYYELMRNTILSTIRLDNSLGKIMVISDHSRILLVQPIGKTQITLDTYLNAIRQLRSGRKEQSPNIDAEVRWIILFERFLEQLRFQQADFFHWHHLSGALPFEPEIFATFICLSLSERVSDNSHISESLRAFIGGETAPIINMAKQFVRERWETISEFVKKG